MTAPQPHDIVAAAGLGGRGRAELGAEPTREGLDGGVALEQPVDLPGQAIGLGERGADGRVEVEDERAFVHLGDEAARDTRGAERAEGHHQPTAEDDAAAVRERAAQQRHIAPDERLAPRRRHRRQQQRRQHRDHRERDDQREHHGRGQRQRQRGEEGADHAAEKGERREHHHRRQRRRDHRARQLAGAGRSRLAGRGADERARDGSPRPPPPRRR